MAFKMKYKAGFNDRLEPDYGCGIPSRVLDSSDLGYLKKYYGSETAKICKAIFEGEMPKAISLDCECNDVNNWQIVESLLDGYMDYDNKGNDIEIVSIILEVLCPECDGEFETIDSMEVNNDKYAESKYFDI